MSTHIIIATYVMYWILETMKMYFKLCVKKDVFIFKLNNIFACWMINSDKIFLIWQYIYINDLFTRLLYCLMVNTGILISLVNMKLHSCKKSHDYNTNLSLINWLTRQFYFYSFNSLEAASYCWVAFLSSCSFYCTASFSL